MQLNLNTKLAEEYSSLPQKIRVITEEWVDREVYCPNCSNKYLKKYSNNKPVADFFCGDCNEDFELKSKKDIIGQKIVDGAYKTIIDRVADARNPNFFLLNYELSSYQVMNFFVIPSHFFVPAIIERRRPLSASARRAGWVGCNILLNRIPEAGRIFLVKNKQIEPKDKVKAIWKKALFLREESKAELKGWFLDVMRCVELVRKNKFALSDVYKFESLLAQQHPENSHIKDKIRQQLQFLRDKGYLEFLGNGKYKVNLTR